jgi:hypothetical protein
MAGTARAQDDGDLRLVGGGVAWEGRVEIFHDGAWGTICDDNWEVPDATVACRQLGFAVEGAQPTVTSQPFGPGADGAPILLDDVQCTGAEETLMECPNRGGWGVHDCSHAEDAGVICSGPGEGGGGACAADDTTPITAPAARSNIVTPVARLAHGLRVLALRISSTPLWTRRLPPRAEVRGRRAGPRARRARRKSASKVKKQSTSSATR